MDYQHDGRIGTYELIQKNPELNCLETNYELDITAHPSPNGKDPSSRIPGILFEIALFGLFQFFHVLKPEDLCNWCYLTIEIIDTLACINLCGCCLHGADA